MGVGRGGGDVVRAGAEGWGRGSADGDSGGGVRIEGGVRLTGAGSPLERKSQMAKQALKQAARIRVQEALAAKQKERLERERRQAALAIDVLTAVAERDEAIARTEAAAAASVRSLLGEGLSVAEVVELCGGQVDAKEVQRLSRIEADPAKADPVQRADR